MHTHHTEQSRRHSFYRSPAFFLSLSRPFPEFKCPCSQLFIPAGIRTTHHIINLNHHREQSRGQEQSRRQHFVEAGEGFSGWVMQAVIPVFPCLLKETTCLSHAEGCISRCFLLLYPRGLGALFALSRDTSLCGGDHAGLSSSQGSLGICWRPTPQNTGKLLFVLAWPRLVSLCL